MERKYQEGLVSVITPVYNASKYIAGTIESALAQDYKKLEIILVDDCSRDNSVEIIRNLLETSPNIVYFKQPTNMGAGAARNKALELAKGQYVAFLDSDDLWAMDKVSRQLALMKEKNSPFSYAAIEMIDSDNKVIKPKRNIRETCDYKYLLHNTIIATSSVIVDRTVLGDFCMPLRRGGQDYATWLMLLRGGAVACGINDVLVKYRVAAGSLSSNKFKSIRQVWEIQTQDEGICKVHAAYNVMCFLLNAIKKYIF